MNRRDLLGAGLATPWLLSASADAGAVATAERCRPVPVAAPDLGFLREQPLMDGGRLRSFMRREGLDAIVVARPANVFYVTNHWPQLDRMGFTGSAIAIVSADPARPLALVMHAFLYYYTHSPESNFDGRLVFPYTAPAADAEGADEPAAAPARSMRVHDQALLSDRERRRRRALASAQPASADASRALAKALASLRLDKARLGIDDPLLAPLIGSRLPDARTQPAENTIRRARLAKSPAELRLMRLAAVRNVDAALAAARRARELGSTRALRAAFFAEAAARGNDGVFMVVDGSSSEVLDEPLTDGMALSIDCVSACRHYHGDFARTIFIGEPRPQMRRACQAIATAWHDIREQLRPGLRFADVTRLGRESLRKQGADLSVSFRPHSVGLFHTDHPEPSLLQARSSESLVLEQNMILSVDCPMFEAGMGGTAHLEDLMLITGTGAEPIHDVPEPVIVV
ncbi:MAG: M24 family metallopeptidase [Pseudomonadota bacterium]